MLGKIQKTERKAGMEARARGTGYVLAGALLIFGVALAMLVLSSGIAAASDIDSSTDIGAGSDMEAGASAGMAYDPAFDLESIQRFRNVTAADRYAAAVRAAKDRMESGGQNAISAIGPGGTPDYFGTTPNYANSPMPTVNPTTGQITGGIRKFVTSLPGLGATNANEIGQYIPVAIPDTTTYPGDDYYVIELGQYTEQVHPDLPPTTFRGYRQVNTNNATVSQFHYLGPMIFAQMNKPVRVKFINNLPTGAGGDMFLPADPTIMGAGAGPLGMDTGNFTENRATVHLHGGTTPWISDGTPQQWTTPAGENTSYPNGVSVYNVPDMDGGVEPQGTLTFYYTNEQSARLLFYHDHSYGITRLQVYQGEAAPYIVQDLAESALVGAGTIPAEQIPLVIQDRTFVDNSTIQMQDPTWNWGTTPPVAHTGDLWWPHVYMPNQNPADISGVSAVGRWDYGQWVWPPFTGQIINGTPNPLYGTTPQEGPLNPGTPNPSAVPESFMDTPMVNGNLYPYLAVGQKSYRFRILNAANDRMWNLQIYYASTAAPIIRFSGGGGSGASATAQVTNGSVTSLLLTSGGAGYTSAPTVTVFDAPGHTPAGGGATLNATIDPVSGMVTSVAILTNGSGYSTPRLCKGPGAPSPSLCTEVSMVPAAPGNWPVGWPTPDGRAGGWPDPNSSGPSFIQIGTEGGFLPNPVVIQNRPVGYDYFRRIITVLNVLEKAVFLGPAERADAVVDFSQVPDGSTLIVYNDAPAPVPAFDTRYDYYTGDPDQTTSGGAPETIPGYGPNTRTIMQIRVNSSKGVAPVYNLTTLQTALPAAYAQYQQPPVVPQANYNAAFNATYPADGFVRIYFDHMAFFNGPLSNVTVINPGSGYTTANVLISGGGGIGANAVANIAPNGTISSITLTNNGTGYTFAPNVTISGDGIGATAQAVGVNMVLQPKGIIEDFDAVYGRMNAMLGVEVPLTGPQVQTSIPYYDADPPSEVLTNTSFATQIGALSDGTQLWKITHNGVDTHAIHWHLVNVQLINRVAWDGTMRVPDPNELGWKDTIRMNPLEDVFIAVRPVLPTLVPFDVNNSNRLLDVTMPPGSNQGLQQFHATDPNNNPATVVNHVINFGTEYMWHCHLLGHEENIMMRYIAIAFAPTAPSNFNANLVGTNASLDWQDNAFSETGFEVQRDINNSGIFTTIAIVPFSPGTGGTAYYNDTGLLVGTTYTYQIVADNTVGDTTPYTAPAGYNTATASSPATATQTVAP